MHYPTSILPEHWFKNQANAFTWLTTRNRTKPQRKGLKTRNLSLVKRTEEVYIRTPRRRHRPLCWTDPRRLICPLGIGLKVGLIWLAQGILSQRTYRNLSNRCKA